MKVKVDNRQTNKTKKICPNHSILGHKYATLYYCKTLIIRVTLFSRSQ